MYRLEFYLLLILLPAFAWAAVPTSVVIRHGELSVDGTTVLFKRETPFGSVSARWRSEIVVLDGTDFECNSGDWQEATYQKKKSNAVTYTIGDWALPCIERGVSYTITTYRQALLFGIIPMRRSPYVDLIEVPNGSRS